jgi:hypothetical protein
MHTGAYACSDGCIVFSAHRWAHIYAFKRWRYPLTYRWANSFSNHIYSYFRAHCYTYPFPCQQLDSALKQNNVEPAPAASLMAAAPSS